MDEHFQPTRVLIRPIETECIIQYARTAMVLNTGPLHYRVGQKNCTRLTLQ